MLFTGQPISAQEALQYGLLNKVVRPEELQQATMDMATSIAQYSYDVLRLGKKAFNTQMATDITSAYNHAGKVMVENLSHADAQEGITAFLEKRHPSWN